MIREAGRIEVGLGAARRVGPSTYYDYPALKEPSWSWAVILYFFLGGLAGGSYLVATLADLFGRPEDRQVARAGRYVALGAILLSPRLLIKDLGRPERFLNMLRIVKTRSPMNLGTWGLSGFGLFVTTGVLRQAVEDGIVGGGSPLARLFAWMPLSVSGVLGSLFAFFVSSYTGVLLSFTNVPFWAKNQLLQGPLFLTAALSNGLAAVSLALSIMGGMAPRTRAWLAQAEYAATVGELALVAGSMASLRSFAQPLLGRRYGPLFWLGAVGLGLFAPFMLRRGGGRMPAEQERGRQIAASILVLLGGLILRAVILAAGRESARQPSVYLEYTGNGRR